MHIFFLGGNKHQFGRVLIVHSRRHSHFALPGMSLPLLHSASGPIHLSFQWHFISVRLWHDRSLITLICSRFSISAAITGPCTPFLDVSFNQPHMPLLLHPGYSPRLAGTPFQPWQWHLHGYTQCWFFGWEHCGTPQYCHDLLYIISQSRSPWHSGKLQRTLCSYLWFRVQHHLNFSDNTKLHWFLVCIAASAHHQVPFIHWFSGL